MIGFGNQVYSGFDFGTLLPRPIRLCSLSQLVIKSTIMRRIFLALSLLVAPVAISVAIQAPQPTPAEAKILDQLRSLRSLPDDIRARTTKQLALDIRALPKTPTKLRLANGLSNLATEGDFGRDTLQEVTTTLAEAVREQPPSMKGNDPAD